MGNFLSGDLEFSLRISFFLLCPKFRGFGWGLNRHDDFYLASFLKGPQLGNENSAQSFSDRSFWKSLRVVDVRTFGSWISAPKCLFFFSRILSALTEVLGRDIRANDPRMSAGYPARKLPLWADFSFLTSSTKFPEIPSNSSATEGGGQVQCNTRKVSADALSA